MTKISPVPFYLIALTLACHGPSPGADASGDSSTEDGDGDGDGEGDPDDGNPDDGDPDTGDPQDGDPDDGREPDGALLRLLHLGLDTPAVDVYLDGDAEPMVAGIEFGSGTDYVEVPAGEHRLEVTQSGDPDSTVLTIDSLELADRTKYSAVAYDYLDNIRALALIDDDRNIDPASNRLQVTHAAADVGQIDVYTLADPPVLLIENLDAGASSSLELPSGPQSVGLDLDDDAVLDLTFTIPELGAGQLIDLYAVNESGGSPVFLVAHMPDGSTKGIAADVCGDDRIGGFEVCDGDEVDEMTCEDLGAGTGEVGCLADCSGWDIGMCSKELVICDESGGGIPDGAEDPAVFSIEVPDIGMVDRLVLSVDIEHSSLSELVVSLDKGGMGTTSMFEKIQTAGKATKCGDDDMIATLDDEAAMSIQTDACIKANEPAVDGTYAPAQKLANFRGMDAAGTWNLTVDDVTKVDGAEDIGTVNKWCLHITPQ